MTKDASSIKATQRQLKNWKKTFLDRAKIHFSSTKTSQSKPHVQCTKKKESAPAPPDMLSSITQGTFYRKVHSQQFTGTPRHVLDCVSIEVSGDVFPASISSLCCMTILTPHADLPTKSQ